MRLSLIGLFIVATLASCKKEKLDINSYWVCNKSLNLDSVAISGKIIGLWVWTKQSCFEAGETKAANKNINVTFKPDHTFVVNENTNILSQGTWKLVLLDNNQWGFAVPSLSDYLYGRILFCGNEVLFNNSYIDGCDNLFTKE